MKAKNFLLKLKKFFNNNDDDDNNENIRIRGINKEIIINQKFKEEKKKKIKYVYNISKNNNKSKKSIDNVLNKEKIVNIKNITKETKKNEEISPINIKSELKKKSIDVRLDNNKIEKNEEIKDKKNNLEYDNIKTDEFKKKNIDVKLDNNKIEKNEEIKDKKSDSDNINIKNELKKENVKATEENNNNKKIEKDKKINNIYPTSKKKVNNIKKANNKISNKNEENSEEAINVLFFKQIKNILDNDTELAEEIKTNLGILKSNFEKCKNEKNVKKQKELYDELLIYIEELEKKYYFLINDDYYQFLDEYNNLGINYYNIDYLAKYKVTDKEIIEKEKKLKKFLKKIEFLKENVIETQKNKEQKIEEKRTKLSILEKEKDIIEDVNKLTSMILKKEQNILNSLKDKVGKIDKKVTTGTRMVIDYNKILTGPVMLAGITSRMPLLAHTKLGLVLGVLGINKSLKNISKIVSFEDYEETKIIFTNYENLINENINSLSFYINNIGDSLNIIDDLYSKFSYAYKDLYDEKYKNICDKLNYIKKELINKERILKNTKQEFEKSKELNNKAKIKKRKLESELK